MKKDKALEKMATRLGYTPGEFQLRRLVDGQAKVKEWRRCLDLGLHPPDFTGNTAEIAATLAKIEHALAIEERELLPYFFAKKKDVQIRGDVSSKITVQTVRFSDDDTGTE